jgi:hypothetical protein
MQCVGATPSTAGHAGGHFQRRGVAAPQRLAAAVRRSVHACHACWHACAGGDGCVMASGAAGQRSGGVCACACCGAGLAEGRHGGATASVVSCACGGVAAGGIHASTVCSFNGPRSVVAAPRMLAERAAMQEILPRAMLACGLPDRTVSHHWLCERRHVTSGWTYASLANPGRCAPYSMLHYSRKDLDNCSCFAAVVICCMFCRLCYVVVCYVVVNCMWCGTYIGADLVYGE